MSLLQLLLSLLLFSGLSLLSSANSITLSLSRGAPLFTNPLENLKYHTAASLARAHHLIKCPNNAHLRLYPRNGFYSTTLGFGTPPQTLGFVMDTGSSLTWFPCTHHHNCTHCPAHIPTFIPESSSSYKNVTCKSPQCKWLFPDLHCNKSQTTCGYEFEYGKGYTIGRLLSETLTFPGLSVHNFVVGCSVSSDYEPAGLVGFGRARVSLPAQLGLTSFSYCMVSHDFDDNTTASSDLVLTRGGGKGRPAANYTPFVPNGAAIPDLYYVSLQSISIGGVDVNVPAEYLVPDAKGNGGTVVDSGTTLTLLEQSMFDLLLKELGRQVGKTYKREKKIENQTGLERCYSNVKKNKLIKLPQFTFNFQGNTKMVLPLENYFSYASESVVCLTIMNYGKVEQGPAIILGNYQQQNYYMEYDLENNRLGIRQQKCG